MDATELMVTKILIACAGVFLICFMKGPIVSLGSRVSLSIAREEPQWGASGISAVGGRAAAIFCGHYIRYRPNTEEMREYAMPRALR
jgi:hypothetical protein